MAYYSSNEQVLRRWASISDRPMPEDFRDFSDRYLTESMLIRQRDPALVSILEGTADAGLKADVISGQFDIAAPTEEQKAEAAKQAEVQRLFDSKPFISGDLTSQMRLRMLSPDLAAQEEANELQQSGRAGHTEKELLQMHAAQKEARHSSMLKGMHMAQAETSMRLRREQLLKQHMGDISAGQVRR